MNLAPMLYRNLLFFSLLCCGMHAGAQSTTFQKYFREGINDEGLRVVQASDGNYVIAGDMTRTASGLSDLFMIKINQQGDTLWEKTYGGTNYEGTSGAVPMGFAETSDKGFVMLSTTYSFGPMYTDIYLVRTDSMGNHLWSRTYGRTGTDYGLDIKELPGGGYIISGAVTPGQTGYMDAALIRIDAGGDTLWTKMFGAPALNDFVHSVDLATDGGFIAAGYTDNYGAGGQDYYLVKTDSLGNILWTKTYGTPDHDQCFCVDATSDGGYILTGITGNSNRDIGVIKTDASGNVLWARRYGGPSMENSWHIKQTADQGYIISGSTHAYAGPPHNTSNALLVKTDSSGDTLWTRTYGNVQYQDVLYNASETSDGGYIVSGHTNFGTPFNGCDVYVVKTNSSGNSGCNEYASTIAVSTFTPAVSAGGTTYSGLAVTTPPTIVSYALLYDSLLCISCTSPEAGFTVSGSLLTTNFTDTSFNASSWLWYFGDGDSSFVQHPTHIYAGTGTYIVTLIVSNACGSDTIFYDLVIGNGIESNEGMNIATVHPNPFHETATLSFTNSDHSSYSLIIYDATGRKVWQANDITGNHTIVERRELPAGFYFFTLENAQGRKASGNFCIE
jgi:PKD repeat protein